MSYIFSKKEYKNFHENGFLLKRSFFENSLCNSLIKDLEEIEHQNIIKSKNICTAYLKNYKSKKYLNRMTYLQRADLECQTVKRFMNLKLLKACSELLEEEDIFLRITRFILDIPERSMTFQLTKLISIFHLKKAKY